MQTVLNRCNQFFERAPQLLLPWRWAVLFVFISCTVAMVYGMVTRFTMDMSLEGWFQDDDPATLSLDKFRNQFGSDDGVYVVYKPKDGDIFSAKSLETLRDFQTELDDVRVTLADKNKQASLLTRIQRIDSLFNARYQIADGDTLISKKLIGREFPESHAEREKRRHIAQGQNGFELAYYSKNFQYGGIRLKTDFGVVPVEDSLLDVAVEDDA